MLDCIEYVHKLKDKNVAFATRLVKKLVKRAALQTLYSVYKSRQVLDAIEHNIREPSASVSLVPSS